jgi:hypothetical protein
MAELYEYSYRGQGRRRQAVAIEAVTDEDVTGKNT